MNARPVDQRYEIIRQPRIHKVEEKGNGIFKMRLDKLQDIKKGTRLGNKKKRK